MAQKTIYLIDAYNLIYRLFFAVPPFTTRAGEPVNAVYWMAKSILGFHEYDQPDYLYFILDAPGRTFREDLYTEYKGTRDRMPDDLRTQEKRIFQLLESMWIPLIKQEWFEADDLIGTLAKQFAQEPNTHTYIVSGDKDLYQCIGPNVSVYDTMKRRKAWREEAIEKFGVPPEFVIDYLAIVGDASDNIPGISGFWPKKAQSLITDFGSLEAIYEACDKQDSRLTQKVQSTLQENREKAFLSKKLATIHTDVPLELPELEAFTFSNRKLITPETMDLFRELEFKSLLPVHEQVLANYQSLWLAPKYIKTEEEFRNIIPQLINVDRISIATLSLQWNLASIILSFGEDNEIHSSKEKIKVWSIEVGEFQADFCIRFLLHDYTGTLVGWDMKEDVKALQEYIENTWMRAEDVQIGMIF